MLIVKTLISLSELTILKIFHRERKFCEKIIPLQDVHSFALSRGDEPFSSVIVLCGVPQRFLKY